MKRLGVAAGLLTLSSWTVSAYATPAACRERLLPPAPRAAAGKRPITGSDLARLRDFGRMDEAAGREPFAVSPDGKHAVLVLRQGDPDTDRYCIGIVLIALDGAGPPRLLDVGGEIIAASSDVHGIPAIPSGLPGNGTPTWSTDGKWIAYLRRDGAFTQVWRVGLDGTPAVQLTQLTTEPSSARWARDGRGIVVAFRDRLDEERAKIVQEGRIGYHYDERFWSLAEPYPHPRLPIPTSNAYLDMRSLILTPISDVRAEELTSAGGARPPGAPVANGPADARAWVAPADPQRPNGASQLRIQLGDEERPCAAMLCRQPIAGLWWVSKDELLILRGGDQTNGGRTALYRWHVRTAEPKKLLETADWLLGCHLLQSKLVCARESAVHPRVIVALDPANGRSATVYDPNPEFQALAVGRVERLAWSDPAGVATYADLVLPPDHRSGQRHPLVVVQYVSRGFLRGGTGDEYPIHALAARGFAVLSFQMPGNAAELEAETNFNIRQRLKVKNWSWRRRVFSVLDAGIDLAISKGAVDPTRIGITGMSDGSSTVQFALINSRRFSAASVSTCCDDPSGVFAVGPSYGASAKAWGYPAAGEHDEAFWKPQSLAMNASWLRVPLLMQLPDGEYRMAAEGFAALQAHGAPVDMYVFPDERHTKLHPAHRLAIYERNLAWFDFWLRGVEDANPKLRSEIARWRMLRAAGQRLAKR